MAMRSRPADGKCMSGASRSANGIPTFGQRNIPAAAPVASARNRLRLRCRKDLPPSQESSMLRGVDRNETFRLPRIAFSRVHRANGVGEYGPAIFGANALWRTEKLVLNGLGQPEKPAPRSAVVSAGCGRTDSK